MLPEKIRKCGLDRSWKIGPLVNLIISGAVAWSVLHWTATEARPRKGIRFIHWEFHESLHQTVFLATFYVQNMLIESSAVLSDCSSGWPVFLVFPVHAVRLACSSGLTCIPYSFSLSGYQFGPSSAAHPKLFVRLFRMSVWLFMWMTSWLSLCFSFLLSANFNPASALQMSHKVL